MEDEQRKIFLIVDALRVHQSKQVTEWASEHKVCIYCLFCLLTARS